jgi:hypothetical protein
VADFSILTELAGGAVWKIDPVSAAYFGLITGERSEPRKIKKLTTSINSPPHPKKAAW